MKTEKILLNNPARYKAENAGRALRGPTLKGKNERRMNLDKEQIARKAFWGFPGYEPLVGRICWVLGHEEDGVRRPAKGFGLPEAIEVVRQTPDEVIVNLIGDKAFY